MTTYTAKRIKDASRTLTFAQFLASYLLGDSEANGTGKILGQTVADGLFPNPLYYVKGNTDYGGTLTDNLNTLVRNTPFTCLGTATGVPDTSYSWFGWHINSNAGTAAAAQIAYAFNSHVIICYERVKTSDTWGAWKLRGSTMRIQTFGSGALTAFPGIFYVASSLTDFVLTLAPSIGGEYHIKFTTAATIGTIDLSVVTSWIGAAPTIAAGKTYELDVLDGVGVIAEVS